MIGQKYVPSREGGVEVVVEQLSIHLVQLGNEVTIFNRKRKQYPVIYEYKGCKIENIFTIDSKAMDATVYSYLATVKAKQMAGKGMFDVLHFHAEGPCLFLNLLPREKHRKYKIVVTIHGLDWQRKKWGGLATKVLLKGEKNAAKYADEIIVLSKSVQDYFKKTYNRETILIPNGINEPCFHEPQIIKEKWGLEKNSYILFVARIVPEKGLHYLIQAWKGIDIKVRSQKKLVIAGSSSHSGDYYNSILDMVKGEDSIIMTGFVEGQTLQELYSNAFLFVLPSDIEGMPMSLLEAMSYGNTCLVSDIPENKDVINDNSYSFNKGNVIDLKEKLSLILSKSNIEERNKSVYCSWDEVVDKTISVYKGNNK